MYSAYTSFILGSMVFTGAARSVVAKLFFQLGFEHPMFLTLLYLSGQALALIPYNIWRFYSERTEQNERNDAHNAADIDWCDDEKRKEDAVEDDIEAPASKSVNPSSTVAVDSDIDLVAVKAPHPKTSTNLPRGSCSSHGLPEESLTEHIIARIPWYIKPAVPAFFNLLNAAMRWASFVFLAASVAEMLISGMELVLSVLATRCVRGRHVTWVRWIGVGVCTVGIILVGIFDKLNATEAAANISMDEISEELNTSSASDQTVGIMLILGQSIMSVIQDLSEEVFMQEADFPPVLLVGMEGLFGLMIALPLYFPIAPLLGEETSTVLANLSQNKIIGLSTGWTLLVTVTGICNIAATGLTSSMTRNVWKNLRTCLIWTVSLIIFYATGNSDLGEEWVVPGSFYILIGFSVILVGIYIYYGKGSRSLAN